MRPAILDPLFSPISGLPGVGPKIAELLVKLLGRETLEDCRVIDLLFHAPFSLIDRRNQPGIARAPQGAIVTITARVDRHQLPPRGKSNIPYRVFLHDETGELTLVFFRGQAAWLEKQLPVDAEVTVSGKIDWFNGRASMVHPDYIVRADETKSLPLVEPIYPLTAGLSPKTLRKIIDAGLPRFPELPEWIDLALTEKQGLPSIRDSFHMLHEPRDPGDIDPQAPARRRLAYDEFLAGQLSLSLVRQRLRKVAGQPVHATGAISSKILKALPFSLTSSQNEAIAEVLKDMAGNERMLRLLQGDVGSGKTLVALMAMAAVIESGGQAVLMAPTEILARQHHATISKFAAAAGLSIEVLTGRTKGREREEILERIASGAAQIIIGTHALFQDSVAYANLMLAVVDEQHRFGVHQRLRLTAKGLSPHMLVMTATPIPRTLVLAAFGDMDVSKLTEKPAGRKPIQTITVPMERTGEIVGRLQSAIAEGKKAYWICPLVEESEELDLMSAEERHATLVSALGPDVGLIHGRMSGPEKDAAMMAFKNGETRLLVATTVVEVGVDVPDATIMVIEHAERFGLAQLHQLRGRVGRGDEASTCILLYKGPLGETGHARLSIMRETEDGFRIAEEDLKLRGEGELLGTRQSGTPGFRIASLEAHADLLEIARKDAAYLIERDPELTTERGTAIRTLLYLFRRDEAIRFLRAG
ncbi:MULTISPECIES: ATP-dependent DNA helicase RecG [Rhizobium]|jgi:ATP-dependent DNA helicase RecG|uniref:ATP-dependent DNA helicase RecG n=1 Tax=Rhizobium TaxID=379 RepID=UPI0004757487|nr:ATP-dependent DNA helicase RecG [Rhizobium leguminosarum]MBA8831257.1 ATP-dependent DNA helicase RecG [Rhizobium leguminosarum]MDH6273020.1 ATP-dependent DNA helicase RecG [Rhizobium leguminosarum]MVO94688.1 ATP-dependent DNA helicase RecG [Rhizobium leguminosarum bv. phaseoli]NKK94020.1 ATP-dependent DNA helicase RecG [Rhizobium leguminosarum bv. viciae]TBZ75726.1 ATP-dependent DNA helicase RecG [Rhizobium leguminosarum bv. viciae]